MANPQDEGKHPARRESLEERRARLAEQVRTLPTEPGCYLMRDRQGDIFYVGKALNLRARVRSYFSGSDTRQFVAWLDELLMSLDVIVVNNEKEALLLERTLVRQHQPRFNVLLRDDKNWIHLRLETREAPTDARPRRRYPRIEVVRATKNDGARYFGPFHSATALRHTLRTLNRHFQLRTCTDSVLENRQRPCLQFQIGRCPAPCVFEVEDYRDRVQEVALFLGGRSDALLERLSVRMWQAAEDENYEFAARLRDQVTAIQTSISAQSVLDLQQRRDQDILAVARKGPHLEIARVVVRGGGMRGTDHFSFEHQEFPTEELLASFLSQLYAELDAAQVPDEVLLGIDLAEDAVALAELLGERRGRRVEVKRPLRGPRARLIEIAQKNADHALEDRLKKSETREAGLVRLQERLGMTRAPRVMECFDISIFQGSDPVASQVCFVDGVAEKSRYRRYHIRGVDGTDDFLMLYQALSRRLARATRGEPLPDLLLVDGGKGQLNVALAACRDAGVPVGPSGLFVAAIAKSRQLREGRREEAFPTDAVEGDEIRRSPERLFVPGAKDPLVLRPHSSERYLIEQIRDEAHRFAITGHRARRKERTLTSLLDEIPGVGPGRRRALLRTLGSVRAVARASEDELAQVPGIGAALAAQIHEIMRRTREETIGEALLANEEPPATGA